MKATELKEKAIVYCFNYEDLITITREAGGKWLYHYDPREIRAMLEKRDDEIFHYLNVGEIVGYKLLRLLIKCAISYGDDPNQFIYGDSKFYYIKQTKHESNN